MQEWLTYFQGPYFYVQIPSIIYVLRSNLIRDCRQVLTKVKHRRLSGILFFVEALTDLDSI